MSRAVLAMKWRVGDRQGGSVPNQRDSSRVHYRAAGSAGVLPFLIAMLVVLVLLAGCGSGNEGPSRPGSRIVEAGPDPGVPVVGSPGVERAPASQWAASLVEGADVLFASRMHEERGFDTRVGHDVQCSGLRCSVSGSGTLGIANADGLAGAGVLGRTGGIELVSASDLDAMSYGGWMRHGGFGVLLERVGGGDALREFRYGLALGRLTEVAEGQDVMATWRGRMVGVTEDGGFSDGRLQGAAELTYRSAGALGDDSETGDVVGRIDAAFTDIANVLSGALVEDARFANVPVSLLDVTTREVEVPDPEGPEGATTVETDVTARMTFSAGVAGNRIRGGFFGPAWAEIAGVFEQNGILGAFGAESGLAPFEPETEEDSGRVWVIDGDTVDVDGVRWRLLGIDAPERGQSCRSWGRSWDCGAAAAEALASRAGGMSCEGSGTDGYGRSVGVCSSGGEDLNAWLVENGWALAYREYAEDYVDQEEDARANGRGIHRGEYVEPWDWRRGDRLTGADSFAWNASGNTDVGVLADRLLRGDDAGFRGHLLEDSVFGMADGVAVSFGSWTGASPTGTGGAVWRGSAVGLEGATGLAIEGDAEIGIDDLASPDVDVALTGLMDSDGAARADMRWDGIALSSGAFQSSGVNGSIEGRFYGAGRDEVGGVFESNGILGAFGAERE